MYWFGRPFFSALVYRAGYAAIISLLPAPAFARTSHSDYRVQAGVGPFQNISFALTNKTGAAQVGLRLNDNLAALPGYSISGHLVLNWQLFESWGVDYGLSLGAYSKFSSFKSLGGNGELNSSQVGLFAGPSVNKDWDKFTVRININPLYLFGSGMPDLLIQATETVPLAEVHYRVDNHFAVGLETSRTPLNVSLIF